MSESRHVYHTADTHITEGFGCWCSPRYLLPCNECDGTVSCWKCNGGTIDLTRAEAEVSEVPLVIVHYR